MIGALSPAMRVAAIAKGAQPLWTPLLLGGAIVGVFDGSLASSITLSGSNVAAWAARAGGISATQVVGASQPTYSAGVIANAGSRFLQIPQTTYSGATAGSVILIGAGSLNGGAWGKVDGGNQTTHTPWTDGGLYESFLTVNRTQFLGYGVSTSTIIHAAVNDGATLSAYKNGSQIGSAAPITFSASLTTNRQFFGYDTFSLRQVVLTNRANTADRQKTEGYFAFVYGLQGLLPAHHPYKSAPPRASLAEMEQWADEQGWRIIDLAANRERARRIYTPPRLLIVPDHGWRIAA